MPSERPLGGERRPRLTPAIADARRAVREHLGALPSGSLALVALSGGPDSLALAAAAAFEAPRLGRRAGVIVVDHGLQSDSAEVAERAAEQARALGLLPVRVVRVRIDGRGGPEGAARAARYAALEEAAAELDASAVLLGHSLDDQAETVLLGLARGSGTASLSGMAAIAGLYRRPFLGVRRAVLARACADAALEPWHDPHNTDERFSRVRVRGRVLPVLEAELGPGIAEALALTAEQLREDEQAFTEQIDEFIEEIVEPAEAGIAVSVGALTANPAALRQRILRHAVASEFGVALSRAQTLEVARLVTDWRGQGPIDLPGGVRARRVGDRIVLSTSS